MHRPVVIKFLRRLRLWRRYFHLGIITVLAVVIWLIIKSGESGNEEWPDSSGWVPAFISYVEDADGAMSAADVADLPLTCFHLIDSGKVPNYGFSTSTIWLRFTVPPGLYHDEPKWLEVRNPLLNVVELYKLNDSEVRLLSATGDNLPFASRQVMHSSFLFDLPAWSHSPQEYLIKVHSAGEQFIVPIKVWNREALAHRDTQDFIIRGTYFGLIVFVLLFNLFIYLVIRERSSLYYLYYNFSLLLLQLSLSGFAFRFLWPGSPYLANVANPFFASLSIYALLRFSQRFLSLGQFYPRINKVFHYTGWAVLANAALALIWVPLCFQLSVLFINGIALLLNLAIMPVAILVYRRNFKPAKFFAIGFMVLVFAVFGFIATNSGLIQNEFYADYGLLIGSAAEVILLSFAIVDRFKLFKEQAVTTLKKINRLTAEQNVMLERKVKERTLEIATQKELIEEQNNDIVSSIRYAQRIQHNLLPSSSSVKELFPESYVMYQPRDIVSGDFFWVARSTLNGVNGPAHPVHLFATGDCTGHGVPGAMMSVMGINLLHKTLEQWPEETPDKLLAEVDRQLVSNMQSDYQMAGEGMDAALCALLMDTLELRYCGANLNLHILRHGQWLTLKATRRPVGMRHQDLRPFELQTVQLHPGDQLYSWTDGLTDQFGGSDGRKLKTSGLRQFLSSIVTETMQKQKELLHEFFNEWKGNHEQVDDVCLVAVKI